MVDIGIIVKLVRRFVIVRFDIIICEGFCSFFLYFIVRIMDLFKIMVGNEVMNDIRFIIK